MQVLHVSFSGVNHTLCIAVERSSSEQEAATARQWARRQLAGLQAARAAAPAMPLHGKTSAVRIVTNGPGPRNVSVEIDGRVVVIPRGNLVAESAPASSAGAQEGVSVCCQYGRSRR